MKGLLVVLGLSLCAFAQTPVINQQNGIVNGASLQAEQGIAPGSLVSIFGSELAGSLAQSDTMPLSTTLATISVSINDIAAPMVMVSPGQINIQVPWNLLQDQGGTGTATVTVRRGEATSEAREVKVNTFSPALFTLPFGFGQAVAVNADGTIAGPPGAIPGTTTSPAKRGGSMVLFATGLGPVDPPLANGANSLDMPRVTTTKPVVLIGESPATVDFSGLTTLFPGVYQITVTLPADAPVGLTVPITVQMGDVKSTGRATISVQE
jgi:uncharacterized protein (TIGR03437 family)